MELTILPLGLCRCDQAVVLPGQGDGEMLGLPVAAHLVRADDGTLILIDTGMSDEHLEDKDHAWAGTDLAKLLWAEMAADDTLVARLASVGVAPDDIDIVINTHLHFDHAGNNWRFPRAQFWVQREQHEFATGNPGFPNRYWNLPGLDYRLLDGETEVRPGVRIIPTPGHVPGHQSVVVSLPETGDLVICGDAVYLRGNYDLDNWNGHTDPSAARTTALGLRELADATGAALVFGHDPDQVAEFPRAPHVHR